MTSNIDLSGRHILVTVVPWAQPDLVRQGLRARKHMLCQKPFAVDLKTGVELARDMQTLAVVEALYRSIETRQAQEVHVP